MMLRRVCSPLRMTLPPRSRLLRPNGRLLDLITSLVSCRGGIKHRCQSSLEMSPFFVLYLFLLLSAVALEKFLFSKPQERRSSSRSTYGIPVFLPCWLGPERSPA